MFRRPIIAAATAVMLGAALVGTGACTPLTTYTGFQAVDAKPVDIKPGEDTKSTVMSKLGSPSATSTFDPNLWYYITQVTERIAFYNPRVASREVVALNFDKDNERVLAVNSYTLKDGAIEVSALGRTLTGSFDGTKLVVDGKTYARQQ